MLFSIIICLFATRFIYYSTLLKHVEDKADFDFLFKEYYPQLYYYAFHLINNMEASKDIVSDAFEFIWANYAKIDKATAKSYLYVYVRNKSIDRFIININRRTDLLNLPFTHHDNRVT